jgi:hypothetical protein
MERSQVVSWLGLDGLHLLLIAICYRK